MGATYLLVKLWFEFDCLGAYQNSKSHMNK